MVTKALRWIAVALLTMAVRRDRRKADQAVVVDHLDISIPDDFDPSEPGHIVIRSTPQPWVQTYPGGWQ